MNGGLQAICAWCGRLEVAPGDWRAEASALPALGLCAPPPSSALTHGLCPTCRAQLPRRSLHQPARPCRSLD